ncbi:MAG: GntR family transcriptional regulator [Pseudomonadota bacterium]
MDRWSDVIARLGKGARVFVAGGAAEPLGFARALQTSSAAPEGLVFVTVPIPGVNRTDWSSLTEGARQETIFVTPELREGFLAGRVRFIPAHYSTTYQRLSAPGAVDTAVFKVTPPASDGTVGLGPTADFVPAVVAAGARLVGAVDPHMPDPAGSPRLPANRLAHLVEDASPPPTYEAGSIGPDVEAIGETIAKMIGPGDTLQLGLGKVQVALLAALADHKDLALHGGMIADASIAPIERGVFSKVTTGVAIGTEQIGAFVESRDDLSFRDVGHTHGAATLAAIDRLVAVNSVMTVDLFGQAVGRYAGRPAAQRPRRVARFRPRRRTVAGWPGNPRAAINGGAGKTLADRTTGGCGGCHHPTWRHEDHRDRARQRGSSGPRHRRARRGDCCPCCTRAQGWPRQRLGRAPGAHVMGKSTKTAPPRYARVMGSIEDRIRAGRYPLGAMLPTELELCAEFGVSRFTVREALRRLTQNGFLQRQQGHGSRVIATEPATGYVQTMGSIEGLFQYSRDTTLKVSDIRHVVPEPPLAEALGRAAGRVWVRIDGLRTTQDREVVCATRVYLHQDFETLVPLIKNGKGPIYKLIERRFEIFVEEVSQTLTAGPLPTDTAQALGVDAQSAGVTVTRRYLAADAMPLIVTINDYPAERFEYVMTLRREAMP